MADGGEGGGGEAQKRRRRRGGGGRGGGNPDAPPPAPGGSGAPQGGGAGRKRRAPRARNAAGDAAPKDGEDVDMENAPEEAPLPVAVAEAPPLKKAHASSRTSSTTRAHLTADRFDSLTGVVSALTLKAVSEVFGYETMTSVQAQALPVTARGMDVVAKAKTGTGKTLAFMIPCVDAAARSVKGRARRQCSGLVLSPTRELAQQTAEEGRLLCRFHPGLRIICLVGGVPIGKDARALNENGGCPDIIVGTPGRLNDHLVNTRGFATQLLGALETLVFDEADQLLDMGFRPAIEKLLNALGPASVRRHQTLLFSATLPDDVAGIVRLAMRTPQYEMIDTVGKEADQTHKHVPQSVVVCQTAQQHSFEVLARISASIAADPEGHKVVVFFTTARLTQFYAELALEIQKAGRCPPALAALCGTHVLEIHSRKSQSHRTRISDVFRESQGGATLFTSDVSARGMDYPDVSHVIQVGLPSDKAQYVHRLGRTARAGKDGSGILLLMHFESFFLRERDVAELPIKPQQPFVDAAADMQYLEAAVRQLAPETVGAAYQSYLGYYNSSLRKMRWDKEQLVAAANDWAMNVAGAAEPPALQAKTIGMMGLRGVAGLNVAKGPPPGQGGGKGGGGGGKGRSGRGGGKGSGGGDGGKGRGRGGGKGGRG